MMRLLRRPGGGRVVGVLEPLHGIGELVDTHRLRRLARHARHARRVRDVGWWRWTMIGMPRSLSHGYALRLPGP